MSKLGPCVYGCQHFKDNIVVLKPCNQIPSDTASHPRRFDASFTLLQKEPKNLLIEQPMCVGQMESQPL